MGHAHTDYTILYEVHHNYYIDAYCHALIIIVVGEKSTLPGVVGIKATIGNRRHWILSLDVHSEKK